MKIALNLTCINNSPSGARNRIKFLYYYLIKNNPDYTFYILEPKDANIQNLFKGCHNTKFIKTQCISYNSIQRFILGLMTIPKIIKKIQPDIYEQFHLPLIELKEIKTVCTIHDIRYSSYLKNFSRPQFLSNFIVKRAVLKSNKVITVSKSLKQELVELTKSKNIEYAYNVYEPQKSPNEQGKNVLNSYIKDDYILSVGIFEDRKNYLILLKSAYLLKHIYPKIKFIIAGAKTKHTAHLQNNIKLMNLEKNIIFLHNTTDMELINLYSKSKLFLFPSKYEGFGIPILEAISYKCKILLSDIKVFREITENKISYFDTLSCEDLTYHILNVFSKNKNLSENYYLDKKILDNFTSANVSKKIINIYKLCVA